MNEIKIIVTNDISIEGIKKKRQCGNCEKIFHYSQVRKKYPITCQKQLKKIWDDPKIEFYCSSCYFLKLFKHLKLQKELNL
jgi:hypothetical protein